MSKQSVSKLFWEIAEEMYSDPSVQEGAMMGFKCLRVNGDFFATLDHKNDALIAKLPKERVSELIKTGHGKRFAPNGRVFKEWVSIPRADKENWSRLLQEAKAFVSSA